jgi:hypothetical protein
MPGAKMRRPSPLTLIATGRGGVATLWSNELDLYVTRAEDDGNERILVTLFNFTEAPLCIINCYLPSGNDPTVCNNYRSDIDALHEICEKYKPSHSILICGDLNADHFHRNGPKERALNNLIREHGLEDPGASDPTYSYVNPHLGHASRLDHFLLKMAHPGIQLHQLAPEVLTDTDGVNSSSHMPVRMKLSYRVPVSSCRKPKDPREATSRRQQIFDFSNADQALFTDTILQELKSFSLDNLDPDDALLTLQHIISTAATTAIPYRTRKHSTGPSKKKRKKWSPELASAVRESKNVMYLWKEMGCPRGNHPIWERKKRATKRVRKVQRCQEAEERMRLIQEISCASKDNQALFHKIVKRQRGNTTTTTALLIDSKLITDEDDVREGFASAAEVLATPVVTDRHMEMILEEIRSLASVVDDKVQVSTSDIQEVLQDLKANKAADRCGFKAEHLKLFRQSPDLLGILATTMNKIFTTGSIPPCAKTAYKTPIHKKGKDPHQTDNYRGITVTSIFGKLIEHLIKKFGQEDMNYQQSGLQYGFTAHRSPCMASLIITEAVAEAREQKKELFICSIDARKAFDIVPQPLLKFKLYNTQVRKPLWTLIDDLYTDNKEVIRWKGADSREYEVNQGVKQGGILSTDLYKIFSNDRLLSLEKSGIGLQIGSIYAGAPAVADDQLLLANSRWELQGMMSICQEYAEDHMEILHPLKTKVTEYIVKPSNTTHINWTLGEDEVTVSESFEHLGLNWKAGDTAPNLDDRIMCARRASYALMGVGLHGKNGLDPASSMSLIKSYVLPRLTYGLNAMVIKRSQQDHLSTYYRTLLRQVQGLPQNTSSDAVHLLIGSLPLEASLDLGQLSLFGAIARLESTNPLKEIAIRQLATKKNTSKSWFSRIRVTAAKYDINIDNQLLHPWPKLLWKKHIKLVVSQYWIKQMSLQVLEKATLQWLIIDYTWIGKIHPVWNCCRGRPFITEAAAVRATLLVGRYGLQKDKVEFTKQEVDPSCPLCHLSAEDVTHFITECEHRPPSIYSKIQDLQQMYTYEDLRPPTTKEEITSAVLNGWGYSCNKGYTGGTKNRATFATITKLEEKLIPANQLCNIICYHLHVNRDNIIQEKLLSEASHHRRR